MLTGNQLEDENVHIKNLKLPSNRKRTQRLKITNSSRGFYSRKYSKCLEINLDELIPEQNVISFTNSKF